MWITFHFNFYKTTNKLLGVTIQTQNNCVFGKVGRTSLITKSAINVIPYWLRIIQLEDHNYFKCRYSHMCGNLKSKPNKHSWENSVCNRLQTLGFQYARLIQCLGDEKCVLSSVKSWLNDTSLMSELNDSSRAISCRHFCKFELQPYLNDVSANKFRSDIWRLRVSSQLRNRIRHMA